MTKYSNIDELFKDKTGEFEITPSLDVWNKIDSKVFAKKKFYYREIIAIAFLLLIGGTTIWFINNNEIEELSSSIPTLEPLYKSNPENSNSSNIVSIKNQDNTDKISLESKNYNTDFEKNSRETESYNGSNMNSKLNQQQFDKPTIIEIAIKSEIENVPNTNMSIRTLNNNYTSSISSITNNKISTTRENIEVSELIEKKKNFHLYTGASTSASVIYYTETPDQFTWTADLNFGYKLKRFYIESGIGYQEIKQNGDYRIEYETNDSIGFYNEVVSFELNPNNTNEISYNTNKKTVYDSVEHFTHQSPLYKYNYVNIPLKIGYRFLQHDKLSVSVETGIIFSILSSVVDPKVTYNTPESKLNSIVNYTPEHAKNNIRIHIGLRANYNIARSISLSVQPEFTKFVNSIYTNKVNGNEMPYTMGVRFGLFFNF